MSASTGRVGEPTAFSAVLEQGFTGPVAWSVTGNQVSVFTGPTASHVVDVR